MEAGRERRQDSNVQTRLDATQQRQIDELHNIQFTLGAIRHAEQQHY